MNTKALARFLYSTVPGLAFVRFTLKDLAAPYIWKPEYKGVAALPVGKGLIFDIGANRGQGVAAFRKLAPQAKIVAIEPEPSAANVLSKRYRKDPSVAIYQCALGSKSGETILFIPQYGRWNCDGMAALSHEEATEWLRNPGRMLYFDESKLTVHEHRLECRTLDSFGLAPQVIKVHAQNAELEILRGSKKTIMSHTPALMCAFPTPAVTSLLSEWGYRPFRFASNRFAAGVAQRPTTFTWYLADRHLNALSDSERVRKPESRQ